MSDTDSFGPRANCFWHADVTVNIAGQCHRLRSLHVSDQVKKDWEEPLGTIAHQNAFDSIAKQAKEAVGKEYKQKITARIGREQLIVHDFRLRPIDEIAGETIKETEGEQEAKFSVFVQPSLF